jgi:hypothetical protein
MVFLTVPYAEKDAAKALGARWNPTRRRWYVADGVATEPFAKWIDAASASASTSTSAAAGGAARPGAKSGTGRVDSYQGKTVVGVGTAATVGAVSGTSAGRGRGAGASTTLSGPPPPASPPGTPNCSDNSKACSSTEMAIPPTRRRLLRAWPAWRVLAVAGCMASLGGIVRLAS